MHAPAGTTLYPTDDATDHESPFELNVRITATPVSDDAMACATDDGCDPTCASACSSGE